MQFDLVFAQVAQGVFEMNFFLVERDVKLMLEFVGDHAGGHGTEHLAVVTGLDLDDADELGNALGEFGHGVELMRLALGATLLERLDAALVRAVERNREPLRKKIVARVTGGDADVVRFTAEADDVVREDDFSFGHVKNS